jgi:hypothetical protein
METKYVRSHSGFFAIFPNSLGLQHVELAEHVDDARNVGDAGFVFLEEGKFHVYGKSLSLGIASKSVAEDEMNAAFEKGELRLYPFSDKGFIVTNAHLPGEFEVVTDLDDLFKKRVFRP